MKILDNREEIKARAVTFFENLDNDIYIIGSNRYGTAACNWLKSQNKNVVGYIDDFKNESHFNDLPIIRSNTQLPGTAIINCVVEGRTKLVDDLIEKMNPAKSEYYFALQLAYPDALSEITWMDNTDSVVQDAEKYKKVYDLLADDLSKSTYESVVNFRLNRDPKFLSGFEFRPNDAYFEPFLNLPENPNFVDAGGFDGSTSILFAQKYPGYSKIYYLEPAEQSMVLSKQRMSHLHDVIYLDKGLWDSRETLKFSIDKGSSNQVSENGTVSVEVEKLDNIVSEKVDFIKMDIESAERKALKGSEETIKKSRPTLAVCVYHVQTDFIAIPEYVLGLHPDYKVYVRHYTQGASETVMFFV